MGRVVRLVVAGAMIVLGTLLALSGMGYVGDWSSQSTSWSLLGSLLPGLSVALGITALQRRRCRFGAEHWAATKLCGRSSGGTTCAAHSEELAP